MDKMRFAKLMSTMGAPKQQSNLGIDDKAVENAELERKLALIDDKIAQLEESDDPNALESLNFWKAQRNSIAGNF